MVVANRGGSRCFIAYRAKIFLVAREQMRHATSIENAAADRILEVWSLLIRTQSGIAPIRISWTSMHDPR